MKTKNIFLTLTKVILILLFGYLFTSCDGDAVIVEKQGYRLKTDTLFQYKIRTTKGYYEVIEICSKLEINDTIKYGL